MSTLRAGSRVEARYWPKVDVRGPDECWEWKASRKKSGHGQFSILGTMMSAHRAGWLLMCGPIPEGMHVLHHCDNPPCVNPNHLYVGTHAQNMRDMADRGRCAGPETKARGESHWTHLNPEQRLYGGLNPRAKLDDEKVSEIRRRYLEGETQASLAAGFGVGQTQISKIVRGKAWHLAIS